MARLEGRTALITGAGSVDALETNERDRVLDINLKDAFIKQHILGRAGQPEDVTASALFLASDHASFITGHSLVVDGGYTAGHCLTDPGAFPSPESS